MCVSPQDSGCASEQPFQLPSGLREPGRNRMSGPGPLLSTRRLWWGQGVETVAADPEFFLPSFLSLLTPFLVLRIEPQTLCVLKYVPHNGAVPTHSRDKYPLGIFVLPGKDKGGLWPFESWCSISHDVCASVQTSFLLPVFCTLTCPFSLLLLGKGFSLAFVFLKEKIPLRDTV